jgi:hypothetical protein
VIALMRYDRTGARAICQCLIVLLSLCMSTVGQVDRNDTKPASGRGDRSLTAQLVLIKIDVQGGYHMPVSDLAKDGFVVLEDGKEQEIVGFRQMSRPNEGTSPRQYEIAYYPPSDDGEFKKVRVRFRDTQHAKDSGLRLTHDPKGYYAILRY